VLDAHGVRLSAAVSRASVADLGIAEGARVLAVFKATAVRWRIADDAPGGIIEVSDGASSI